MEELSVGKREARKLVSNFKHMFGRVINIIYQGLTLTPAIRVWVSAVVCNKVMLLPLSFWWVESSQKASLIR